MLDHCAACPHAFRYLGEGKIYAVEHDDRSVEWFWLCGQCAPHFEISQGVDGHVSVVPKMIPTGQRPAA
jgi:hypothetical protein